MRRTLLGCDPEPHVDIAWHVLHRELCIATVLLVTECLHLKDHEHVSLGLKDQTSLDRPEATQHAWLKRR